MKHLRLFFEDANFKIMLLLKAKLGITWNEVIARGLKGGRNGKSKDN